MSIRTKLLLLIATLAVTFGLSAATYLTFDFRASAIGTEEQSLLALRAAFYNEGFQANRLATTQLAPQEVQLSNAVNDTHVAFQAVHSLKVLPTISDSVRESLTAVDQINGILESSATSLQDLLSKLDQKVKNSGVSTSSFVLAVPRGGSDPLASTASDLISGIDQLSGALSVAVSTIGDQYLTISNAARSATARSAAVAIAVAAALLLLSILLALRVAANIVKSLKKIEVATAAIAGGDLTQSIVINQKDEIGRLSMNLNNFVLSLRTSLNTAQNVSLENVKLKEELIAMTQQTSASSNEIDKNSGTIRSSLSTLDENMTSSSDAVQQITASISALDSEVQEQGTMVEESTASVTQMIASIDNIAKVTDRRRASADTLLESVSEGGRRVLATLDLVKQINESVGDIQEITGIIQGISSQTNLLAMNAAIEAAHAGDAGRGFAVVSDEIRKLAEASAENSQQISSILSAIIETISHTNESGTQMSAAFDAVDREVKGLHSSLTEIFSSMNELRLGGDQILEAMNALRDLSIRVRTGSDAINESTSNIRTRMESTATIAQHVNHGMIEITGGIEEIANAIDHVMKGAERLGSLSESLNLELMKFRTAE